MENEIKPDKITDDSDTDKAVEDIVKHDSDELMHVEDEKREVHHGSVDGPWYKKWWRQALDNKKVSIPLAIVAVIIILFGVPFTRYQLLGLVLKDNYSLTVWDDQTNQPISSASVSLAGKTAVTDNHGIVHMKVPVGYHTLKVTKNYYATLNVNILVPLRSHAGSAPFSLHATGRLVPVSVVNKISGQPVENATVKAAGTETKTDKNGQATIVLPPDKATLAATITASGYNDASATVQVTSQTVSANKFQVTPAGKIYFLSNLSGKIDVVKTNLDGTDRQTVLAGTGNEDQSGTVLLASTDWKYLALLSKRDTSGNAQINLINTDNDQLTNIDKGNALFTLVGWSGHYFVYQVNRNGYQIWQPNAVAIKSYNADNNQLGVIDQTQAEGDQYNYAGQQIEWITALKDEIVYFKTWQTQQTYIASPPPDYSSGKQAQLVSAKPSGSKTVVKSFVLPYDSYADVAYEPNGLYFEAYSNGSSGSDKYENGQVTLNDPNAEAYFNGTKSVNYYLISPSGNQAFWSESRDGKNVLFVGDSNGQNGKQIASQSDYDVYGWYTDDYLLVFKNSSELYIMPVGGGNPLKITNYYKPVQRFDAYGGR